MHYQVGHGGNAAVLSAWGHRVRARHHRPPAVARPQAGPSEGRVPSSIITAACLTLVRSYRGAAVTAPVTGWEWRSTIFASAGIDSALQVAYC
jgi:hypothetical protein